MPSHLIGILSLGPCISCFFSRGSTPRQQTGVIYIYLYYIYRVLDFRVVVFWWRAEGPPENAKTRKFKKTRCRWMHPKTRKSENLQKKTKPENAKIWKYPKSIHKKTKTRNRENLKIRTVRKMRKTRKRENLKNRKMRKLEKNENAKIWKSEKCEKWEKPENAKIWQSEKCENDKNTV